MSFKKRMAVGLLAGLTVSVNTAKAQYAQPQWGSGMYGAMQPCPYPVQVGNGAESYLDEYREIQRNLEKEKDNLDSLENRQKHLADVIEEATDVINGTVEAKYADFIIAHMTNQNRCSEYQKTAQRPPPQPAALPAAPQSDSVPAPRVTTQRLPDPPAAPEESTEPEGETKAERLARQRREKLERENKKQKGRNQTDNNEDVYASRAPASEEDSNEGANYELLPITGFTERQWSDVCLRQKKGGISPIVCSRPPYVALRKKTGSESDCRKALLTITNGAGDLQKFETEIASSKRKIARLEDQLDRSQKTATRRSKRESTESGFCAACEEYARAARQRQQYASLATAAVGGLVMYSDYKQNQKIAQYNSDLGWATQPASSNGAGAMLIASGLAGYISGGTGAGTYGCATGLNGTGNMNGPMGIAGPYGQGPGMYPVYGGNSAIGYPPGMMGPQMGGGMYMPGQGPWGANGPYALNNGGIPGMVAPGGPMMGGPMGGPMGGMPGQFGYGQGGYPAGGYNPYAGMGGVPGGSYYPYQGIGQGGYGQPGYGQPYGTGFNGMGGMGMNPYGGMGMNPYGMQNGQAAAITMQGLQTEAMNLQNRMNALSYGGAGMGFSQYGGTGFSQYGSTGMAGYGQVGGGYSQYGTGFNQYGMSPGRITGNLTIGGTFGATPAQQPVMPTGSGVIVPAGTR